MAAVAVVVASNNSDLTHKAPHHAGLLFVNAIARNKNRNLLFQTTCMKNIIALLVLACCSSAAIAQTNVNLPANNDELLARAIRIYKAPLVEKAKITEAQADKVVAIIAEIQIKMRDISADQSVTGDDRMNKLQALRAERDKKFKAIPLTDEEMKNVSAAIDEIRKNMQAAKPANN